MNGARRIRQHAVAALLASLIALLSPPTRAAEACPASKRPVIVLTARVKPPDQVVADALRDHLRTQLADRGIDLCVGDAGQRTPIAQVLLVVERPDSGQVSALVRIGDAVTDKRVERSMDLTRMPPDARALAVSSSADELLRATWAELLIADAPEPKIPPPDEVMTAVVDSIQLPAPKATRRALQLGVLGSATRAGDLLRVGPELLGAIFFGDHLGVTLRMQFGFSPREDSANGSVAASSQGAQAGLALALNRVAGPAGVGLDVGAGVHRVAFNARARGDAVEASTADWTAELASGPRGWLDAGPVRLSLGAELVYALRPTSARDTGELVFDSSGFGGRVSLGVLLNWLSQAE